MARAKFIKPAIQDQPVTFSNITSTGNVTVQGTTTISGSLNISSSSDFTVGAITASSILMNPVEIKSADGLVIGGSDTFTTSGVKLNIDGAGNISTTGNITSSGAISASGDLSIKGFPSVSASLAAAGGGGGTTPTLQQVTDQGSSTTTPITASIISASGDLIGDDLKLGTGRITREGGSGPIDFSSTPLTGITNITASGNISASGDITGNTGSFNRIYIPQSGLTEAIIDFNGGSKIGGNAQAGTDLLLSANDDMHFGAGDDVIFYSASLPDGDVPSADAQWLNFNKGARTLTFGPAANEFVFSGNITASSNISASGEITINGLTNIGLTSLTLSSSFTTELNFSTNRIMSVTTASALSMSIDTDDSILGNVIMTDISSSVGLHLTGSEFKVLNGTFDTTKRNYVYYHYIGNDTALVTINQES